MRHRITPLADRMPVRKPITPHLLAAVARRPVSRAEEVLESWCTDVEAVTDLGRVLVFRECVIGRPRPLLLEAANHLRAVRRADARHDASASDEWEPDHDPPTIPQRVLARMADGQEAHDLVDGASRMARGGRPLPPDPTEWIELIDLTLALEWLVTELAGSIRIGSAAVVDARLAGERPGVTWAA